jgi:hypothetical protein
MAGRGGRGQIREAWLIAVLETMLRQFPFQIRGFHSDHSSEFIKSHGGPVSHGSFIEPEVELPLGDPRGDGEVVPVELVLKNGRNPTWGPGAYPMGALTQAAFVYEDDDPALFLGFFLSSGQMFSFQSRIAASFRSRARPVGRWQLHLSL